ncbi:MAG TPA: preprotein translocase subunit YajC [Pusillimonas sp.]|jgi:preprotein translocase subunit YajC|nr:preprotein translocase subunit YajC [Pusillimonas sp.]MBC43798.1 preprotein translocase subunit YajC [Pusillimonas sp.]HBT31689.1 preprotein translocase subunit YajC [Pusillimonas sp.]HCN73402.1 preprotein translocase subunit YajC [Pusillimonas sp.]HCP78667.1 preprotein translocase subunit YajC [Pusillimonas sp.]|tara:strand:+ start:416 stop:754 length:339 start_codon:yes stop_codon:yes gene_type:complete
MSLVDTLSHIVAQAGEGNALMGMLPIILMFVILYFLMIRPQMKRQKEHRNMVAALAKGDEIITTGGMLGKVTKVSDSYITVEVTSLADKPVEVVLQRTAVASVLPKGTIKAL